MSIFVDTSAFVALLSSEDRNHALAQQVWTNLVQDDAVLTCTNYVVLETNALIQRRLGMSVLKRFQEDVVPFLRIIWVDERLHWMGVTAVITASRCHLSLVDCASFAAMRQTGLDTVFAFDQHFAEQGFNILS